MAIDLQIDVLSLSVALFALLPFDLEEIRKSPYLEIVTGEILNDGVL